MKLNTGLAEIIYHIQPAALLRVKPSAAENETMKLTPSQLTCTFLILLCTFAALNPAGGQEESFVTATAIARDAGNRALAVYADHKSPDEQRAPRLDVRTSAKTVVKLSEATRLLVGTETGHLIPGLSVEADDVVMRCASRDGRDDPACRTISPRVVIALTHVKTDTTGAIIIYVAVVQWEKASRVSPPGFTVLLRYVPTSNGHWKFDKQVGVAVG